jgi:basic membrane lipoprotein Med (substrate-binding protein (PBP1-ABC) superfamily)
MALAMGGASMAQDFIKVAAVWTVPVEQQWASRLHNALMTADEQGKIDYVYSENISNTDYERVMREYAEQGVNLIVGEAFGVEQPARAVASEYPEIAFLMGSSLPPVEPNFATFDNFIQEPSYLSGIVAGLKTKTNKIGMVGGYAIPEVNRLMNAFKAGALSVNPDVKFSVSFINSWYDPPKATLAPIFFMPSVLACPTLQRNAAFWPSAMSSTPRPTIRALSSPARSGTASR